MKVQGQLCQRTCGDEPLSWTSEESDQTTMRKIALRERPMPVERQPQPTVAALATRSVPCMQRPCHAHVDAAATQRHANNMPWRKDCVCACACIREHADRQRGAALRDVEPSYRHPRSAVLRLLIAAADMHAATPKAAWHCICLAVFAGLHARGVVIGTRVFFLAPVCSTVAQRVCQCGHGRHAEHTIFDTVHRSGAAARPRVRAFVRAMAIILKGVCCRRGGLSLSL